MVSVHSPPLAEELDQVRRRLADAAVALAQCPARCTSFQDLPPRPFFLLVLQVRPPARSMPPDRRSKARRLQICTLVKTGLAERSPVTWGGLRFPIHRGLRRTAPLLGGGQGDRYRRARPYSREIRRILALLLRPAAEGARPGYRTTGGIPVRRTLPRRTSSPPSPRPERLEARISSQIVEGLVHSQAVNAARSHAAER